MTPDCKAQKEGILEKKPPMFNMGLRLGVYSIYWPQFIVILIKFCLASDQMMRPMNRRAKIITLQEKIKNLEWKLNQKDNELEELDQEKLQIGKEKDIAMR